MRRATGAVRAVGLVSQGPIPGDRHELGTNHRKIVSCIPSGLNMPEDITVVPYDAEWPELFRRLGRELRAALQDLADRIDHIDSTFISGMAAKPILDIQISVAGLEPIGSYKASLESLGFDWRVNNPDLTKRYFREISGSHRVHIHVRQSGSWGEQFSLLFRDYMRTHPEDAAAYSELKH